ncbi:MAG: hypothetical protein NNA31_05980 [Nitrospira sp.]|nr:hypothetical protein [Nitrospira sp.]
MTSALAAALKQLCRRLRDHGLSVKLGAPGDDSDLALWPWQLTPGSSPRSAPVGGSAPTLSAPTPIVLELRFLLVSNKASEDAVHALTLAQTILAQSPIMQVSDTPVQIVSEALAPDHLGALFTAAGICLSLSSAYVARCTVLPHS